MSSSSLDKFNSSLDNYVVDTSFSYFTVDVLLKWRNEAPIKTGEAWGRCFAIVIPSVLCGIIGLVDAVASVIFGVLTLPGELCGIQLSRHLFLRSFLSVFTSLAALTYLQYANFSADRVGK